MNPGSRVRLVKGPAIASVVGRCSVLGCDLSDSRVRVRRGKILPFELGIHARLDAELGAGAKIWTASPYSAGTMMWRAASKRIIQLANSRPGMKVTLLGDSNAGKSTFCLFLANCCISAGLRPLIVDSDIGQSDLGPPGVVTSEVLVAQVTDLRDAIPVCRKFEFVGSISPSGFENEVISAIEALLDSAKGGPFDVIIINTDGFVAGPGKHYKLRMSRELDPDVLVFLGPAGHALSHFYHGRARILRARASRYASKSIQDRVARRGEQFAKFVGMGRFFTVAINDTQIVYRNAVASKAQVLSIFGQSPSLFMALSRSGVLVGFGAVTLAGAELLGIRTDYCGEFDSLLLSDISLSLDENSGEQSGQGQII